MEELSICEAEVKSTNENTMDAMDTLNTLDDISLLLKDPINVWNDHRRSVD